MASYYAVTTCRQNLQKRKPLEVLISRGFSGGSSRARTVDNLIKSQLIAVFWFRAVSPRFIKVDLVGILIFPFYGVLLDSMAVTTLLLRASYTSISVPDQSNRLWLFLILHR